MLKVVVLDQPLRDAESLTLEPAKHVPISFLRLRQAAYVQIRDASVLHSYA